MNDLDLFRNDHAAFAQNLNRRGGDFDLNKLAEVDQKLRSTRRNLEILQADRNILSRNVADARAKKEDASSVIRRVQKIKKDIEQHQSEVKESSAQFQKLWSSLPNLIETTVPDGASNSENISIRQNGDPRAFSFPIKDHVSLGEKLQNKGLDFASAAKISGARFVILNGLVAKLHRVLAHFMVDHNVSRGYLETEPPVLVREKAMFHSGQLPKFANEAFITTDGRWLIPTAEVALTNYVQDRILHEGELPLRLVAHTNCFRQEAGAAGQDTRGMIRQHQFSKVELVSVTVQEDSTDELAHMLDCGEAILNLLKLPYRVVELCAGDIGFGACKSYDIEVWIPSQNQYREISSCSNCGAFQARRMQARYRQKGSKGTVYCHTLNGSALAVGRTVVAIIENYQNKDGSISIPDVLQPAMGCDQIPSTGSSTISRS